MRTGKPSSRRVLPPILTGIVRKGFQLPRSSPNPVDFWITLDFTHRSSLWAPFHHQSSTEDCNFCNHFRKGSEQILSSLRRYTLNSLVNPGTNEARFPTSLNLQFSEVLITIVHFLKLVCYICHVHPSTELQMKILKGAAFAKKKRKRGEKGIK